jgi:uncharacterized protein YyaL (SSP411 family)
MPPDEPRASGPTRSLPRVLVLLAGALLIARVATGLYERAHPPATTELVQWVSAEAAEEQAKSSGLPILYEFGAEWCGPCRLMAREVFADPHGAEVLNRLFVPVRVTDRQREEGRNPPIVAMLQMRYRIEAFPTLVIVPPDGSTPTFIEGYPGKDALVRQLAQAAAKARLGSGPRR